jgi:hypothetical protein
VVYQNTAGASTDSRSVQITPSAGGAVITANLPVTSGSGVQTTLVDLYGSGTSALATAIHSFGFNGISAAYSVTLKHSGTEKIDAIQLDLSYTTPAFRAETTATVPGNCLASTYTGGSSGQCAVISSSAGYQGGFYIQGTTYTPSAVIDLTLSNFAAQVLRFGVVSRALWVKETGSLSYPGPVIEIPNNSPGFGAGETIVYLNVYTCSAAPTCSSSTGKLRLRASVFIVDPSGTPAPPSREITVLSWAALR